MEWVSVNGRIMPVEFKEPPLEVEGLLVELVAPIIPWRCFALLTSRTQQTRYVSGTPTQRLVGLRVLMKIVPPIVQTFVKKYQSVCSLKENVLTMLVNYILPRMSVGLLNLQIKMPNTVLGPITSVSIPITLNLTRRLAPVSNKQNSLL